MKLSGWLSNPVVLAALAEFLVIAAVVFLLITRT